jgi:hypothetical protein
MSRPLAYLLAKIRFYLMPSQLGVCVSVCADARRDTPRDLIMEDDATSPRPAKGKPIPFRERIWCSLRDAETATSISRSNLYRLMRLGRIKWRKEGKRRLISVPSLEDL